MLTLLEPDPNARLHLLVGHGKANSSFQRLLQGLSNEAKAELFYVQHEAPQNHWFSSFKTRTDWATHLFPDEEGLLAGLERFLLHCRMGLRLYVYGHQVFVNSVVLVAKRSGLNNDEIQTECTPNNNRIVYCVHCRTLNHDVKTPLTHCSGCHRHLEIRDHYSHRLGAYKGVVCNAEEPGPIPVIRSAPYNAADGRSRGGGDQSGHSTNQTVSFSTNVH
ncbi:MAG: dimethylamine monooxygenase subunit DmmA family protein [Gemmataceae bacterium]